MDDQHSMQAPDGGELKPGEMREVLRDAIRYWELRRILYNGLLTAVVVGWVVISWPHFRGAMSLGAIPYLLVFAALANLCYCAAYLADVPMQFSVFQAAWRRWRWVLYLAGTLFAILLANYWIADEIYPYPYVR